MPAIPPCPATTGRNAASTTTRASVDGHRRDHLRGQRPYRCIGLGQCEVDHRDLAGEVGAVHDEHEGEQATVLVERAGWHAQTRRHRRSPPPIATDGKRPTTSEPAVSGGCSSSAVSASDRRGSIAASSRAVRVGSRRSVLRMELPEHGGQHPRAQACADPAGLDGVHLAQHPRHRLRRHDAQHRVAAHARQADDNDAHVRRVELSEALLRGVLLAGLDQLPDLGRDLRRFIERDCAWPGDRAARPPSGARLVRHGRTSMPRCGAAMATSPNVDGTSNVASRTQPGRAQPTRARGPNAPRAVDSIASFGEGGRA